MPNEGTDGTLVFLLSSRGEWFMRWRGVLAFLTERSADPHDDAVAAHLLEAVADEPMVVHLSDCWRRGHADGAAAAHEMSIGERDPMTVAPAPRCGRRAAGMATDRGRDLALRHLAWSFRRLGERAHARGIDRSPSHDRAIRRTLKAQPNENAPALLRAWEAGWDTEADRRASRFACAQRPDEERRRLARRFRWIGQLAYAKGIDRSPSHDRATRRIYESEPNDVVLAVARAWEAGWDEAEESMMQLALERRSILEMPRILDARPIRGTSPRKAR